MHESSRRCFMGVLCGATLANLSRSWRNDEAVELEVLIELVRKERWHELYQAFLLLRKLAEEGKQPHWADREALLKLPLELPEGPEEFFRRRRREDYERKAEKWNKDERVISSRPLVWQDFADPKDLDGPHVRATVIMVGV